MVITLQKRSRVVIVGAGFGGMQAAQSLAQSGAEILLIDRNPYHTFVPLLYQVAAAQLEPEQIIYPMHTLVRRRSRKRRNRSPRGNAARTSNLQFLRAEVKRIDFSSQTVETENLDIPYDYLVLATGSRSQFFDVPGASDYALPLRTLEEAIVLRDRILSCFEQASQELDAARIQQLLTFVVVGGGATGVEVAGALTELIQNLSQDYLTLDVRQVRVVLLQSGDRLLPEFPQRLGGYTQKQLCRLGVSVRLQARVSQVTQHAATLQDGQTIPSATVIWTAGVEASLPATTEQVSQAAKGKLRVQRTLQLPQYPNVYAIGDLAYVQQNGKPLAGVAPEALQQGVAVARNIRRQLRGCKPLPFRYFNKGRLAIIGGYTGVGKIGPLSLTGFLPWLMWLSVHLVYLPGFRNRLFVFFSWIWNYLLGDVAKQPLCDRRFNRSSQLEDNSLSQLSLPRQF